MFSSTFWSREAALKDLSSFCLSLGLSFQKTVHCWKLDCFIFIFIYAIDISSSKPAKLNDSIAREYGTVSSIFFQQWKYFLFKLGSLREANKLS